MHVPTTLRFTQSEVRHIACLLARNPDKPEDSYGREKDWKRDHDSLQRKFEGIDARFADSKRDLG